MYYTFNVMKNRVLVFIPTFNEKDNVQNLLNDILALEVKELDVLFIDDNSPDGTGEVLNGLAKKYDNVFVKHRNGKSGIGSAHKEGIKWAYKKGYKTLVTMDSDMTHSPSYIPKMIKKGKTSDLVIASRYLSKRPMVGWNVFRSALSYLSHFILKFLFKLDYDASNAYRLYRLDRINSKLFTLIRSNSYSFFFESLYILKYNGTKIVEIPATLKSREHGSSKMSINDVYVHWKIMLSLMMRSIFKKNELTI